MAKSESNNDMSTFAIPKKYPIIVAGNKLQQEINENAKRHKAHIEIISLRAKKINKQIEKISVDII